MRVVIAGGHGKIALLLQAMLAERGDQPVGLVRNADHADDLRAVDAEPVVFDLERGGSGALAAHLDGADAVVFAAGAGPGSGIPRKDTVDRGGAVPGRLTDAPPTGHVHLAPPPVGSGEVPRTDVAAVLLALLDEPGTAGATLELVSGPTRVDDAVRAVTG